MKKIFLFSVLIAIAVASCKKVNNPNMTVTASFPTITFPNGIYFSVPLNGTLPTVSQVATAYDSFYKESLKLRGNRLKRSVNTFATGFIPGNPGYCKKQIRLSAVQPTYYVGGN